MTAIRRTALIVTSLLVGTGGAHAQAPAKPGLQELLEAELARFPAKTGIWVKHLTLGDEIAIRADDSFNSASVIKLTVLGLAFQMADHGELSLGDRVTIMADDFRGGSGIFHFNDPGLQPTMHDVLLQMVITSDNTATDIAIGKVGGVARVNEWIRQHGWGEALRLNMTTGELFAKYKALPKGTNQNEKTVGDPAYWLGAMTPRATGQLLEAIERCRDGTAAAPAIATQKSCAEMIRFMRAQQSGALRLPHFLTVPVAHKTGDFPPVLANDVGIIFARSGPIVVAFFANGIQGSYAEAEDREGRIAQLIVEYFDGAH